MKAITILVALIVVICALESVAQTNALWFKTVVLPTNTLSLRKICEMVETESAKLASNGCGLKVIYPVEIERMFTGGEVSLTSEPHSLFHILWAAAECADLRVKVLDTVAVITRHEYRFIYMAVEGTCADAETGTPITNFRIETDFLAPLLAVQTNGYFVCGIPQRFDYSWTPNAIFSDHDISGVQQVIRITAPGYMPLAITNALYDIKTGKRHVDMKLKRSKENELKANKPSDRTR